MGLELQDNLLMNWVVNTLIILAINNSTQRGKIFENIPKKVQRLNIGRKLQGWIYDCLPCMATFWGTIYYYAVNDVFIIGQWIIYIISLSGFIVLFEKVYDYLIRKSLD